MSGDCSGTPVLPPDRPPALRLSNIGAGYSDQPVLRGLDLTIAAGEAFALLGPNGSGKSTAARVACGLLKPTMGEVSISGAVLNARGRRARHVGLAPQECALFPALTIRENLSIMVRLCGMARGLRSAAIARAMALVDCSARGDQAVATLSGGWKRRANLAAALVSQPAFLVIDEPTEGVDAPTRLIIARAIRQVLDEGAGCLIISHDAAFVEMTADRIGVLGEGRLIASGRRRALLAEAFADDRVLSVRFLAPPTEDVVDLIEALGLARVGGDLTWRLLAGNVLAVAEAISNGVDDGGGEMTIRRPGLDELVERLRDPPA